MNTGRTVFSQLMDFLPLPSFRTCVKRYRGDYKVQSFSCLDQFLTMAFAQLTYRESLRDIEVCLRSYRRALYHMGIRGKVSRNTLANANLKRDWRIYADFAQRLIKTARGLYTNEKFGIDLDNMVYAFDATTIDLCLSLFPWARFRKNKGGVKLHTLYDVRTSIPAFVSITEALVHDMNMLDVLFIEPGAFYIMDRAYLDFERLYRINQGYAFFLLPAKSNTRFQRITSRPVDKKTGLICDQTVALTVPRTLQRYPAHIRRIRYKDKETGKTFVFLTNHFTLPAEDITELYRYRWQIELFFKWIKQHLRIKSFFGTTPNAVKTQVWIAFAVYVLVAIVKKRLRLDQSMYSILQILSVTLFEKRPLAQVLNDFKEHETELQNANQLNLFD